MDKTLYDEFYFSGGTLDKGYYFTWLLLTFFTIILVIAHIFNYRLFYKGAAMVVQENGVYYLRCYVEISKIDVIIKNNYIDIGDVRYHYQIQKIDDKLYVENGINYQLVDLWINIPNQYRIDNLLINYKIPYQNKKIISYLKDII